ncbi:MAG: Mercuric ion reductase [uncultured Solirubrobacteraceae bacterium]|uniref:Mercuric ion reductase n=1 Tax=uncultured Solirubrobacteraceae bacterium TaxID=1162706 RepID=A0A6J4S6T2_9ACTN|nr:MAG: Mercuric ion reductase [uncultured Solirubrobacteraceae bacterium]
MTRPRAARLDLIIVGMGSAGMVAAQFASTLGIRVACAERDRIGGDCLWTGCVPSKALLASAKAAHAMRNADAYGLAAVDPAVDTARVWARIHAIQDEIAATDDNADRFRRLGVDVLDGAARLLSPTTLRVGEVQHATRFVLLATGSRPALPQIDGLAAAAPLTSERIFTLTQAPASVVMIGGGPITIELAQALVRLGVPVTVLQSGPRILPREEPALARRLLARLRAEGVEVVTGVDADRVSVGAGGAAKTVHAGERSWTAQELFVGAGRAPNVEDLGLEEAGVRLGPRGVVVDRALRSSVASVYAAGDVAGRHIFTHAAGYEAARAVRNMFFPGSSSGPYLVPWCTFTDPELARAGLTEAQARAQHGDRAVRVWRQDLAHSDRARTESASDGELRIVTAKGRVVGAHLLAPNAGEVIGELALAIDRRLKLTDLANVVHVYPTIALAIQQLAAEAAYAAARRVRWLVRLRA